MTAFERAMLQCFLEFEPTTLEVLKALCVIDKERANGQGDGKGCKGCAREG